MIKTIIKLLTFIPWIIYFVEIMYYRISIMEKEKMNRKKYLDYLNKNFFKSLNLNELILYFIFIIFLQFGNTLVLELLFSAIYIYLLINFFMNLASDVKKIRHKRFMVLSIALIALIIGNFLIFNHLYFTYHLMFFSSILSSLLIYIFSFIYKISNN